MKITLLLILFCVAAYGQGTLQTSQLFPIDAGHSYIEFSVPYMGYAKVKGRFGEFRGMVIYDKDNVANTSVSLTIKTESIDTDHEFRDTDLKSDNWFDAAKFPSITFQSKKVVKTSTGFDVTGDLTMKGVTKEVVLKMAPPSGVVKDIRGDLQVIVTGTTSIDRTVFGVEGKNWSAVKEGMTAVGKDVTIELSVLGKQFQVKNYENFVVNAPNPAKIYKLIQEQGMNAGISEFKTMVENKSVQPQAMMMVSNMLRLTGKPDEALAAGEANKAAFPDRWEVYYSLGETSLFRGEKSKAQSYFNEALKRDPENVNAQEILRHF